MTDTPDDGNLGFVSDKTLLKEHSRVEDLLDLSAFIKEFKEKYCFLKESMIIGLLGPYGSGKSTLLYQMENSDEGNAWITFDAWKFPERQDLWEGFALEVALQLGGELNQEKVRKKIDGEDKDDVSALIETLSGAPMMGFLQGLKHFARTTPAKRVYQIQKILTTLFANAKGDIFIVIEDIDRSGDAGIFFLETMKNFIVNQKIKKSLKVIVPISNENFYKNQSSYVKTLDYFESFGSEQCGYEKFIAKILLNSISDVQLVIKQLSNLLQVLARRYPDFTIRHIKTSLSKANINFKIMVERDFEPDLRLVILFELLRFCLPPAQYQSSLDLLDHIKRHRSFTDCKIVSDFLIAVQRGEEFKDGKLNHEIKDVVQLTTRKGAAAQFPSQGWYNSDPYSTGNKGYRICDFYLDY